MASIENDVRKALRQVLETVPNLPRVAWENQAFTPTPAEIYVRETLLITEERPDGIGPITLIKFAGEAQYDVTAPLSTGSMAAGILAGAIKDVFFPGLRINQLVFVDESRSETGYNTDQFYMKPVRVKWRAYYDAPLI